jgi:hypothetical protein
MHQWSLLRNQGSMTAFQGFCRKRLLLKKKIYIPFLSYIPLFILVFFTRH